MAIGDYGNSNGGNNNNRLFENTYYSRLRFKQSEGKLNLTASFRSGLLILDISKKTDGFKYDSLISVFLSPTKARLLANEIDKFKAYLRSGDIISGKAFGVNTGMGDKVSYIGFSADTDKRIFITIGKIDGSGNIIESQTIDLNLDYHFALEWDNIDAMDVTKVYDNFIELDQLHDLVYDFGRNMSGASAYAQIDLARYDNARILKKMDPIFDKLGIERKTNGNSNYGDRSNSFLDNSKSVNGHTSIDDIEGIFE